MQTIDIPLSNPVASGATFTASYPTGKARKDYIQSGAILVVGQSTYTSPTVSLGASSITITNPTGRAIAAGTRVILSLNSPAENAGSASLGALARYAGHIEYAGSPVSALTPDFVGQRCLDATTGTMWVASTLLPSGWRSSQNVATPGTPVLVMGGDHPYAQWQNGQWPLYQATGVRPYLAINTNSTGENNLDPGQTDMLSWAQIKALTGVEILSHGARHIQDWTRINTGVTIRYSGANGTATVTISSTQITCTDSGANAFTLSSDTLTTLAAAINALSGWSCTLAPELSGNEPASTLIQIAATSVKNVSQTFACGGAVMIKYNGTAYREVGVFVQSNVLKVYADGVRVVNQSLTGGVTLSTVVTNVNGAVSGLVCKLCDNQKTETPSFASYISGSELAASILPTGLAAISCVEQPVVLQAGLSPWYMAERQMTVCQNAIVAQGITSTGFANSGSGFIRATATGHAQFNTVRANSIDTIDTNLATNAPRPVPTWMASFFRPTTGLLSTTYTTQGRVTAIFDALADSPGFTIDLLMHKVLRDGTSSYDFTSTDTSYYDQTEANWVADMAYLKTKLNAGQIASVLPKEMPTVAGQSPRPKNLVFNPKFKNAGESLLTASASPVLIPGWQVLTDPSNYSAVTVDANGDITCAMLTGSEVTPLQQYLWLEPGKTYDIGVNAQITGYASGNGISIQIQPVRGWQFEGWAAQQTNINRSNYTTSVDGNPRLRFTVPAPKDYGRARIISASFGAGIDMTTNKKINLNVFAKGAFDIDCSVGAASAASVQAHEAAAAINAAIKANSAYPAELHNIASAENGRVILEVPRRGPDNSFVMLVVDGTATSITATMFGASDMRASSLTAQPNPFAMPVALKLLIALSSGASAKFSRPFCEEVGAR